MTPPSIIAHRIHDMPSMPIVPAGRNRTWMDSTTDHFANRCLPMLMANQHGWQILNTHRFWAVWNGSKGRDGIHIQVDEHPQGIPCPVTSHFGHGILTFHLNYLFRTSKGFNLWIRGPANVAKHGIAALEGIVESDWSAATFTMNWRFTAPRVTVEFEPGEPLCMISPVRRGEIESFEAEVRQLADDPDLGARYVAWEETRKRFLSDLADPHSAAVAEKWQKDYMLGIGNDGEHQIALKLNEFRLRKT